MAVIVILIAVSLGIAVVFLGLFIWSLKHGQYDDTDGPSVRMLFNDPDKLPQEPKK